MLNPGTGTFLNMVFLKCNFSCGFQTKNVSPCSLVFHGYQQFFLFGQYGRSLELITHCRLLKKPKLCGIFLHVPLHLKALLIQGAADPFVNVSTIIFRWRKGVNDQNLSMVLLPTHK
jgi:hypothetical protein